MNQCYRWLTLVICCLPFYSHASEVALPGVKAVNAKDVNVENTTTFSGGVKVATGSLAGSGTASLTDALEIVGTIKPNSALIGQKADLVMVVNFKTQPTSKALYLTVGKKEDGSLDIAAWDGKTSSLLRYATIDSLSAEQAVELYKGVLAVSGSLEFYFGLRFEQEVGGVSLVLSKTPLTLRLQQVASKGSSDGTSTDGASTGTDGSTTTGSDGTSTGNATLPQFYAKYNFTPNPSGYKFENYGNDDKSDSDLTIKDVINFFGKDKVCASPDSTDETCVLTAAAEKWRKEQVAGMNGGHCEGMAVTSLRLLAGLDFNGKKTPSDFQTGANTTYDLEKDSARNYIATYFVTQSFGEVSAQIVRGKPSEIIDKLAEAMNNGQLYAVGFYQPGYKGGHAVTPYGIEKKSDTEAWLYVYDNNFPNDNNRVIKVDRSAETWIYEGGATRPDEAKSDYRGDANTNTLEIVPQTARDIRPYACSFCDAGNLSSRAADSKKMVISVQGEGNVLVTVNGKRIGTDPTTGEVINELTDAEALPAKNGLGKNIPPQITIPITDDKQIILLSLSGKGGQIESELSVLITAPGFSAGFDDLYLEPDQTLTMGIQADGKKIGFVGGDDGETPELYIATDPVDATAPSYLFEISGISLTENQVVLMAIDEGNILVQDSDDNEDAYDVRITRTDKNGEKVFEKKDVAIKAKANAAINFADWNGTAGKIKLKVDDEGDGFDDEEAQDLN